MFFRDQVFEVRWSRGRLQASRKPRTTKSRTRGRALDLYGLSQVVEVAISMTLCACSLMTRVTDDARRAQQRRESR